MQAGDRLGDFELECALDPETLFVARRRGERVLLRIAYVGSADAFVQQWIDEAQLVTTLTHPHLCRVLEVGNAGEYLFAAFEYTDGARPLGTDVTLNAAITIGLQLCGALHYLHEARTAAGVHLQVVHRAVSPRSIVVDTSLRIRLLYDTLVPPRRRPSMLAPRQRDRFVFMSPEQCRGRPLDARSDQYSLASVLWELTVGAPRFAASLTDFEVLEAIVKRELEPPSARQPAYPRGLERVLMRALSRDPDARYPSMVAFADALASCSN